ncbi:acrosomal protein KIAA1210 isoform X1 [Electrophorus electricus]|uniref:DUF4592 domain-containing protein n=2 Tax=Electrophorus electricus TaxID=8005 RepID=A0A4W4GDP4_ELEEL|nr:acrosomal protein KIAA1210 isoform X1 [Electrophorus electricus]
MAAFYSCLRGKNRDRTMASGPVAPSAADEPSDAADECPGKKKSRFQTFKNFFVKKKRKGATAAVAADDGRLKSGQSSDDINTPEPTHNLTDKDSDSGYNIKLGNKALSHDSVFASDSPSSEINEALTASQESIHGKVKSLQLQLKSAIRLGSPAISGRSVEESATLSEDDGLPCSPPGDSSFSAMLPASSQRSSGVVQRRISLSLEESDSDDDQMSNGASSRPSTPQATIPVDFSHPASSLSCLDSSAARHRIAVNTMACAKRKPASREMLQSKKRDLRERVLLRDTDDKLRAVGVFTEGDKNQEDTEVEETVFESQPVCSVLEQSEEEPPASTQSQTSSRTSATSAEYSDKDECVPHEDHHPSMEFSVSAWENPVTLELHADDFLLDAGCEVVSEEQGSLLEEVLSSLKGPLTSGLVQEPKDVGEQMKVEDVTGEDVPNFLAEDIATNLLDSTDPTSPLEEQVIPVQNTLCKSAEYLGEVEDTSKKEEPVVQEICEEAPLEDLQVPEGEPKYEDEEQHDEKKDIDEKLYEESRIMKKVDEVSEEEVEIEKMEENKKEEVWWENEENEVDKEEEVEIEKSAEDAEELKDDEGEQGEDSGINDETCPPEEEELEIEVEKASIEVESFDQCVKVEALVSTEVVSQPENLQAITAQESVEPPSFVVTTSVKLSFPSRVSNIPQHPTEREDKSETLQEEANEQHIILEGLQDRTSGSQLLEEHKVEQEVLSASTPDSQPQFIITPAWQNSLSGGVFKEWSQPVELPQPVKLSAAKGEPAFTASTSSDQLLEDVKTERPHSPVRSCSVPSLPLPREISQAHAETTPENPFGVRLRKTAMLHRYASEGESPTHTTQPESADTEKILEQLAEKPALPKKPDQVAEGAVKPKRSSDLVVGKTSLEATEPPSWISVARQKQKLFKENSLEESSESKVSVDEELVKKSSLLDLSCPVTKDVASLLKPVASPVKVACSLEISKPSLVEKESKRMTSHLPPAPLVQEEPPWLALAKKKAKAWSEMPQIVQ